LTQSLAAGQAITFTLQYISTVPPAVTTLWVGSNSTGSIGRFSSSDGTFIDTLSGGGLIAPQQMVTGPDGNVYVADSQANTVFRFSGTTGSALGVFIPAGSVSGPIGVAFSPDGNLLVTSSNNQILKFNGTGGAGMGVFASGNGLNGPKGMSVGPDGNLYIVNSLGGNILRFSGSTGVPLPSAGNTGAVFATITQAYGQPPGDLGFGPDGNLYVIAGLGGEVYKFNGQTGAFVGPFASETYEFNDFVFGPDNNLYVSSPPAGCDCVTLFNGTTGAYVGYFIARAGGGLDNPGYMLFR
jgi:WD40 repeat protein